MALRVLLALSLCILPTLSALTASASHILVKDEATANELLAQLTAEEEPADFAELSRAHSICGSKDKGGDLGTFRQRQMVAPFDQAVFSPETPLGEVVGPVQSSFGWHLIKVTDRSGTY
mmetsp:Transcript_25904/g.69984  ORF Transcript_25904/g.69984 Transcript_25904/m.69984 type:complete len:119 (+) Transcript_25904:80-436(+)